MPVKLPILQMALRPPNHSLVRLQLGYCRVISFDGFYPILCLLHVKKNIGTGAIPKYQYFYRITGFIGPGFLPCRAVVQTGANALRAPCGSLLCSFQTFGLSQTKGQFTGTLCRAYLSNGWQARSAGVPPAWMMNDLCPDSKSFAGGTPNAIYFFPTGRQ